MDATLDQLTDEDIDRMAGVSRQPVAPPPAPPATVGDMSDDDIKGIISDDERQKAISFARDNPNDSMARFVRQHLIGNKNIDPSEFQQREEPGLEIVAPNVAALHQFTGYNPMSPPAMPPEEGTMDDIVQANTELHKARMQSTPRFDAVDYLARELEASHTPKEVAMMGLHPKFEGASDDALAVAARMAVHQAGNPDLYKKPAADQPNQLESPGVLKKAWEMVKGPVVGGYHIVSNDIEIHRINNQLTEDDVAKTLTPQQRADLIARRDQLGREADSTLELGAVEGMQDMRSAGNAVVNFTGRHGWTNPVSEEEWKKQLAIDAALEQQKGETEAGKHIEHWFSPEDQMTTEELEAAGHPVRPERIAENSYLTNPVTWMAAAATEAGMPLIGKYALRPALKATGGVLGFTGEAVSSSLGKSATGIGVVEALLHHDPLVAVGTPLLAAGAKYGGPFARGFLSEAGDMAAGGAPSVMRGPISRAAQQGIVAGGQSAAAGAIFATPQYLKSGDLSDLEAGALGGAMIGVPTGMAGGMIHAGDFNKAVKAQELVKVGVAAPSDAMHDAAMAAMPDWWQNTINKYRGFMSGLSTADGKPIRILVRDPQAYAAQAVADSGGSATEAAKAWGHVSPDGSTIYLNANPQAPGKMAIGHEIAHPVLDEVIKPTLEQSLKANISKYLYTDGTTPTPEFQAFMDDYQKRLGATRSRGDLENEYLAEISRNILSGHDIETFAMPQTLKDRIKNGVGDYLKKWGIVPAGKLGFNGTEVAQITKNMRDVLYAAGEARGEAPRKPVSGKTATETPSGPETAATGRAGAAAGTPETAAGMPPAKPGPHEDIGIKQTHLGEAENQYVDTHPEVVRAREKVNRAQSESDKNPTSAARKSYLKRTQTAEQNVIQSVESEWNGMFNAYAGDMRAKGFANSHPEDLLEHVRQHALGTDIETIAKRSSYGTKSAESAPTPPSVSAPATTAAFDPENAAQVQQAKNAGHTDKQIEHAATLNDAIGNKTYLDYRASPKPEGAGFSASERRGEHKESPAQKRAAGEAPHQLQRNKSFVPKDIAQTKSGRVMVRGFSPDKLMANLRTSLDHLDAHGIPHGYSGLEGADLDAAVQHDLHTLKGGGEVAPENHAVLDMAFNHPAGEQGRANPIREKAIATGFDPKSQLHQTVENLLPENIERIHGAAPGHGGAVDIVHPHGFDAVDVPAFMPDAGMGEHDIYIGNANESRAIAKKINLERFYENTGETAMHGNLGLSQNGRWRYPANSKYVFWWEPPTDLQKESVSAYLRDRGISGVKHKVAASEDFGATPEQADKDYDAAHGFSTEEYRKKRPSFMPDTGEREEYGPEKPLTPEGLLATLRGHATPDPKLQDKTPPVKAGGLGGLSRDTIADVIGRGIQAGRDATKGSGRAFGYSEQRAAEAGALLEWAKANGVAVSELPKEITSQPNVGRNEHDVWFDPESQRWVKVTKLLGGLSPMVNENGGMGIPAGFPSQYLHRLDVLRDKLGIDTPIHGIQIDRFGNPQFIVSQDTIRGTKLAEEKIPAAMKESGFEPIPDTPAAYYRASDNTAIFDAHAANLVLGEDGIVYPFDAIPSHPKGEVKASIDKHFRLAQQGTGIERFKNALAGVKPFEATNAPSGAEGPLARFMPETGEGETSYDTKSTEKGPVFYSRLQKGIDDIKQDTMTVEQATAAIKKSASGDEINLSGILTDPLSPLYGKDKNAKVSKSDLQGYAIERAAKVEDVVLGGPKSTVKRISEPTPGYSAEYEITYPDGNTETVYAPDEAHAQRIAAAHGKSDTEGVKFEEYTTPGAKPGSYREMFVTWPEEPFDVAAGRMGLSEQDRADYKAMGTTSPQTWQDGHSQYSSIKNPIIRIRRNLRSAPNGKTSYFVEEIQGPNKENQAKMPLEVRKRIYEIGMKRAMRDAIDEGAEQISWTDGQTQADRYDLSKHLSGLWVKPEEGGNGYSVHYQQYENTAYSEAARNVPKEKLAEYIGEELASTVPDYGIRLERQKLKVGGEGLKNLYDKMLPRIANKLTEKFGGRVTDGYIWVEGEMTTERAGGEYRVLDPDGDVVAGFESQGEADDFIRDHGDDYITNVKQPVHTLDITPKMKEAFSKGQALFMPETKEGQAATDHENRPAKSYLAGFTIPDRERRPGQPLAGGGQGGDAGALRKAQGQGVQHVADSARDYVAKNGPSLDIHPVEFAAPATVHPERAKAAGELYDTLPNTPEDPDTQAAYKALGREVDQQYRHAVDGGIHFEFGEADPYESSADMMRDVAENKNLKVYTGGSDHPLLGSSTTDENGLTLNDKFRAVHDLYGHASEGNAFGPVGEERAWLKHSRMFSPEARRAMTTETRGQNSWVNYGPQMWSDDGMWKGDKANPEYIRPQDRPFAEQKVGLLPEEWSDVSTAYMRGENGEPVPMESTSAAFMPETGTEGESEPQTFRTRHYHPVSGKRITRERELSGRFVSPEEPASDTGESYKLPAQKDGTSKAWIKPDGEIVPLKEWHASWMNNNPEVAKEYGITGTMNDTAASKAKALDAGFTRINLVKGKLIAEVGENHWNDEAKDALRTLIEHNIGDIISVDVSLLSKGGKSVVGGEEANVYRSLQRVNGMDIFSENKYGRSERGMSTSVLRRAGLNPDVMFMPEDKASSSYDTKSEENAGNHGLFAALLQNHEHDIDPRTGRPTLLTSGIVPAEKSAKITQALSETNRRYNAEIAKVVAGEPGASDKQANDLLGSIGLGDIGLEIDPIAKGITPAEGSDLEHIGTGGESATFGNKTDGVVYKVFYPQTEWNTGMADGVGLDGRMEHDASGWSMRYVSGTPSSVLQKLHVIASIGGIPSEMLGVTDGGAVVVKQPIYPQGVKLKEPGRKSLTSAYARAQVELAEGVGMGGHYVTVVDGKPYIVSDLTGGNHTPDNQGHLRISDAVVAPVPDEMLEPNTEPEGGRLNEPTGILSDIKRAIDRALEEGGARTPNEADLIVDNDRHVYDLTKAYNRTWSEDESRLSDLYADYLKWKLQPKSNAKFIEQVERLKQAENPERSNVAFMPETGEIENTSSSYDTKNTPGILTGVNPNTQSELGLGKKFGKDYLAQVGVKRRIAQKAQDFPEALPAQYKKNTETGKYQIDPDTGKLAAVKVDYDLHNTPLAREAQKGIRGAENRAEAAASAYADKLVENYHQIEDDPKIMAGKSWYNTARDLITGHFKDDKGLFAQLLGATSARTPVGDNYKQALEAFNLYKKGAYKGMPEKYLNLQRKLDAGEPMQFRSTYSKKVGAKTTTFAAGTPVTPDNFKFFLDSEGALPLKANGKEYNANSLQVLRVLAGDWKQRVGGPKTPNFAGNLSGDTLQATIDVWAARNLLRLGSEGKSDKPWRILPEAEMGVSDKDFYLGQNAYKKAAEKLGMNPDELQSILWFSEKKHWENRGWTRGTGAELSDFNVLLRKTSKTGPLGEFKLEEKENPQYDLFSP